MQTPDPTNLTQLGAVALIAILLIKEIFSYLRETKKTGNGNGSSVIKVDLGPLHQKLDQLLKVDAAGQKTSDWWELTFARIVRQCLEDFDARRQDNLEEVKKQLERQISLAVAEISRQLRDRN